MEVYSSRCRIFGDFDKHTNLISTKISTCDFLIKVKSVTELNALVSSLQKEMSSASKGTPTASPDSTRRMVAIDNLVNSRLPLPNLNLPL